MTLIIVFRRFTGEVLSIMTLECTQGNFIENSGKIFFINMKQTGCPYSDPSLFAFPVPRNHVFEKNLGQHTCSSFDSDLNFVAWIE